MKKILLNWKHYWVENYRDYSLLLSQYDNIMLAPPAPMLTWFAERHPEQIVAQEVTPHSFGAHTGALGPLYLKKIGVTKAIIGHQEQRARLKCERYIEEQYRACCEAQIVPILCFGEKEQKNYEKEIISQIAFLQNLTSPVVLAYEPLWAIGQSQHCPDTHLLSIYELVIRMIGQERLKDFFYGGSILGMQHDLLQQKALSGFLVGRLSLDLNSLGKFLKDYQQHIKEFETASTSF